MKKVIGGALYDTETAKLLGEDSYSNPGDFQYWVETLYRTKSGKYFLHGEGGAMTKYAVSVGQNEWCGGEKIIPLDLDSAQKWAEEHLDGDEYIRAFGEPEERTTISISAATKAKLSDIKVKTGKPFGDIIADALANRIERR